MSITALGTPQSYTPKSVQFRIKPDASQQFQLSYDGGTTWVDSFRADSLLRDIPGFGLAGIDGQRLGGLSLNPTAHNGVNLSESMVSSPIRIPVKAGSDYLLLVVAECFAATSNPSTVISISVSVGYQGEASPGTSHINTPQSIALSTQTFGEGYKEASFSDSFHIVIPPGGARTIEVSVAMGLEGQADGLKAEEVSYGLIELESA